ncbi:MAG TPA: DUF1592 domain-containing protein [Bdellovibrionales bacterium]|nr:DUF1592 domain-containing protein [Bdellovibrionales bacterium]
MNTRYTKLAFGLISALALGACGQKSALQFSEASSQRAEAFACNGSDEAGPSDLRRLSRRELVNTLTDLFGASIVASVQPQIDQLPAEDISGGFDNLNLSANPDFVASFFNLAETIATRVATVPANLSSVAGSCSSATPVTANCLSTFIRTFGQRVFRRPLTPAETSELQAAYQLYSTVKSEAFISLIMSMLVAPAFMYKFEVSGAAISGRDDLFELSPYELASRLSYTIWGSMPDAQLFASAASGALNSADELQKQVERLLASPRAKLNIKSFYSQWLELDRVPQLAQGAEFLEGLDGTNLRSEMIAESQDFVDHIIWTSNGSIHDLMTSKISFAKTTTLAKVYGVPAWTAGAPYIHFGPERAGIMTRAAFLASDDVSTLPFRRAKKTLSKLLCYQLKRPDPSLLEAGALDDPPFDASQSTRQRYEYKTSPAQCMTCHSSLNPVGFSLEGFDTIGRFRQSEKIYDQSLNVVNTLPVNTNVQFSFIHGQHMAASSAVEMSETLSASGEVTQCFVRQWFRFGNGRFESQDDNCHMRSMHEDLTGSDKSILSMIKNSALKTQFRQKRLRRQGL